METKIKIEALQKSFSVDLKDVAKAKRNRSFLNASNCCHSKIEQKKFCSECQKEVEFSEIDTKLIKVGKELIPVPKAKLDSVIDYLDELEEVVVKAIIPYSATFGELWKEGLIVATNSKLKRKASQYSELKALLKDRIFVAEGVIRKNQYQFLMYVFEGNLYLRKLIAQEQFYPEVETTDVEVSKELIAIENQILDKVKVETFDLSKFVDVRAEKETELIEEYVLGEEELPEVSTTDEAVESVAEASEVEKMKELLATIKN